MNIKILLAFPYVKDPFPVKVSKEELDFLRKLQKQVNHYFGIIINEDKSK